MSDTPTAISPITLVGSGEIGTSQIIEVPSFVGKNAVSVRWSSAEICTPVPSASEIVTQLGVTSRKLRTGRQLRRPVSIMVPFFIIPRSAGLLGQMLEQDPGSFFRLANDSVIYIGPEPRG